MLMIQMFIHKLALHKLPRLFKNEEGAVAIEYALLAALIALAIAVGAGQLGTGISTFFSDIATALAAVPIP